MGENGRELEVSVKKLSKGFNVRVIMTSQMDNDLAGHVMCVQRVRVVDGTMDQD